MSDIISITSRDNQYLKLLRSLHNPKGREQSGLFLAEGEHIAGEAVAAGWPLAFALLRDGDDSPALLHLRQLLAARQVPLYSAPPPLFAAAADTQHPQGILLAAKIAREKLLPPAETPAFYAYADAVADPGNLGAIMRSAYAAGAAGLILRAGCADIYNPKTVRSAMGALFRLPCCFVPQEQAAKELFSRLDAAPYAAAADGMDIRDSGAALRRKHVWLLGSEAAGLDPFWRENAAARFCLPMRAGAESLNVAAAATVLFYQSKFAQDGR